MGGFKPYPRLTSKRGIFSRWKFLLRQHPTREDQTRQSGVGGGVGRGGVFADVALGWIHFMFGVADHHLIAIRELRSAASSASSPLSAAESRRRLSASPPASPCPLQPVSSDFLHFLPCQWGNNPFPRTLRALARARVSRRAHSQVRLHRKGFPKFPDHLANEKLQVSTNSV